jgi:mono/diheme cytochrome c family protein
MKPVVISWLIVAAVSAQTPPAQTPPAQTPGPQRPAATAPAGNAEEGKKLFVSYGCYQCHGYEAQGSNATGPRLGPRPIAFAAFSRYVRQPTNQMPPYTTKVVSDADLANIYAFVQSRPAPPTNVPLLK